MSGAFEVTAGAFAVVGVADVLVRTGRELYNFLCNIEEAPTTTKRLCDSISEIVALADASRTCLLQLKTRTQGGPVTESTNTLSSALRALDREVRSLRAITAKLKGSSKRWSNIRYALSEQRIDKALKNLEQSKSLLISALTLVDRELSGIEHENIEELVRESTHRMASDLGDMALVIQTNLDDKEQATLSRQRTLESKLDTHHHESTTMHKSHTYSLMTIQRAQANAASSQGRLEHASKQISEETTRLSHDLKVHGRASDRQHQKTRDFMASAFKDLRVTQYRPAPMTANHGRQIEYGGDKRDLIGPALYFLMEDFTPIFDQLVTDHCQELFPSHVSWLQSELQNLVASAAQENARVYTGSTAHSFDSWTYTGAQRTEVTSSTQATMTTFPRCEQKQPFVLRKKTRKRSHQPLQFKTSKGTLRIRLPRRDTAANALDALDEISLSYLLYAGEPFLALHARFTRPRDRDLSPSICAQLQIFLPFDESQLGYYCELLENGTKEDFARALHDGSVSPYRQYPGLSAINPLHTIAAICGRVDVLRYLDDQGVGRCLSHHDASVSIGALSSIGLSHLVDPVTIYNVISSCADVSSASAGWFMLNFFVPRGSKHGSYLSPSPFLKRCLDKLFPSYFDANSHIPLLDPETLQWNAAAIPDFMRFLLDTGVDPNLGVYNSNFKFLEWVLASEFFKDCPITSEGRSIKKEILSALIQAGADVLHRNEYGYTVADVAWRWGHWDAWCEALQENGLALIEVDQSRTQWSGIRWRNESEEEDVDSESDYGTEDTSEYDSEEEESGYEAQEDSTEDMSKDESSEAGIIEDGDCDPSADDED